MEDFGWLVDDRRLKAIVDFVVFVGVVGFVGFWKIHLHGVLKQNSGGRPEKRGRFDNELLRCEDSIIAHIFCFGGEIQGVDI